MKPQSEVPDDPTKRWYQNCPIGVNILKNMMSVISKLCHLETRYTNHSLRATAATLMFNAGVPEKVIADCTSRRSTKGLRHYEHTSAEQLQAAGLAVANETTYTPSDVKEQKPLALTVSPWHHDYDYHCQHILKDFVLF